MDEFSNQLIEAPEDEDIDDLNDETFGDSGNICADWEPSHELTYTGFSGHGYTGCEDEEFDFDDVLGMQETEALAHHLSQLVVEDDEDIDQTDELPMPHEKKKTVNLDQLFGPHSPPGLFDAEERAMGQPNIWGSPARDSYLQNRSNAPVNKLLQSLFQKAHSTEMPMFTGHERLGIPDGAKTLEEIEQNLMDGSNVQHQLSSKLPSHALTVEELERQLRGEDAAACGNDFHDANHLSGAQHAHGMNVGMHANHNRMGSHPIPMPQRPFLSASGGSRHTGRVPSNGSPSGGGGRMPIGSPSGFMWPQGMNVPPRLLNNPMMQQQMMAMYGMNMRFPPGAPQAHRAGFMFPHMPPSQGLMRPGHDNVIFNQHRHGGPPVANNLAYLNFLRSTMNNSQQMPFPRLSMPVKAAFPLQRQQLFQQQQMMMMQQQAAARFHSGHGGSGIAPRQLYDPNADARVQSSGVDEYAGLMTQREKDWIIKIQLLQLHTDNPYVDDYYFTCWSLKKMLRERKQREGIQNKDSESEPALVLPQLARVETKAYTPAQFEGALGRLTAASIHNPRQMISVHISTGQEFDEARGLEVKRFKELLLRIEKSYENLLDIEDTEKKALAQPPENRQSLYDERTRLISQLYRRLKRSTGESQVEKQSADTEDGLSQIISIRKGLMLILRLIPLLDKVDARAVVCLLIHKLAAKKDWQSEELLPKIYGAVSRIIRSADLEELVIYAATLTSGGGETGGVVTTQADKNAINRLVITMQSKLGLSTMLCLINRCEVIYTTQSPLDLDVSHQNDWRSFVETTASAVELCDERTLVHPLDSFPQVLAHFRRILDKRWLLSVEDKLEALTAADGGSNVKASVT